MMTDPVESADLVVVGAGWAGLAAAKTYLQVHPESKVIVLEAASSVGGTWSTDRLYPGLKSNNLVGTYEYPDYPMDEKTWGVKPGEHIPAQVLHDYLTSFAVRFGVMKRTRLNCKVETAARGEENGWVLTTSTEEKPGTILTKKLIVATGLTSEPFLPQFEGQDVFGVPLFHSKHFLQYSDTLKTAKRVTVYGGTKSAWDAVYAYATAGIAVDWVIRESGHGPCWMAPPYVTPLKKWLEKLVHTRLLTWMSPCIWGDADGYGTIRSYLHGTAIGRLFVNGFWGVLGGDVVALNKYSSHPETAKLQPWMAPFWTGGGLSILNYPTDFFQMIKDKDVKVHIADITKLSKGHVLLSTGETLETDAMHCSTGWKHGSPIKFIPASLEQELGLPTSPSGNIPPRVQAESDFLTARADDEILAKFPRLKDQPQGNTKYKSLPSTASAVTNEALSSLDLYRFMVPANAELLATHDIAFAGSLMTITTAILAQVQALWITAYFDGKIMPLGPMAKPVSSLEIEDRVTELQYSARLHNRFGRWRYPHGWGGKVPDFVFDALPFVDLLLGDLGLEHRRKKGWFMEATEPYGPEDYIGVVEEWMKKNQDL